MVDSAEIFSCVGGIRVPQVGSVLSAKSPGRGRPVKCSNDRDWVNGQFLKGPIRLDWLCSACKLGGKTLATALAVWYVAGLRRRYDQLSLTSTTCAKFGVDRSAKSRGLEALEGAGLISVERRPRKNPVVTILLADG